VQLAVLVDRPHRELPIQADFVGASVRTRPDDRVDVQWRADGGVSRVQVERPSRPAPTDP
jgi:pyrimidine operon attenuation protein/uracil phosphoribosyltransferase